MSTPTTTDEAAAMLRAKGYRVTEPSGEPFEPIHLGGGATEAGRRLMEALADEHCSIDSQGCHAADEVRAEEFVPLIETEARNVALGEAAAKVRDSLMTGRHRLERTGSLGAPACSCGDYDSADESVPAEAWRGHLIEVAVAAIEEARE